MLVVTILTSVSCWGCATSKNSDYMKTSSIREIQNAKNLHLIKQSESEENLAKEKMPEITAEEYEKQGDDKFRQRDLGMAFIKYQKSIELNPKNYKLHYKVGLLYLVSGMNKDAVREFKEVLKKEPKHALSHEGRGIAFFRMKKYKEAEISLRQAIKHDPKLWKPHNFLGIIKDYNGKHIAAVREYESALKLSDKNGIIYNNLGTSHLLAGNYHEAIDALTKVPQNEVGFSSVTNNLGIALAMVGRYDEALEAFERGGDEAQAYNNLGCIHLRKGEKREAIRCFEKAIKLKPTYYATARKNLKKARLSAQLDPESQYEINTKNILQEKTLYEEDLTENDKNLAGVYGEMASTTNGISIQHAEGSILEKSDLIDKISENIQKESADSISPFTTGSIKVGKPEIWKDLTSNSVKIRFTLKNIDMESAEIKAYSFIVLSPAKGSQESPKCFPKTTLKDGRPLKFQKGEPFSISRYKIVSATLQDIDSISDFKTATVYVYSEKGNLLSQKSYEINKT